MTRVTIEEFVVLVGRRVIVETFEGAVGTDRAATEREPFRLPARRAPKLLTDVERDRKTA